MDRLREAVRDALEAECTKRGLACSPAATRAATTLVSETLTSVWSDDLVHLSRHCKRASITRDDVSFIARHVERAAAAVGAVEGRVPRKRKGSGTAVPAPPPKRAPDTTTAGEEITDEELLLLE